MDEHTEAFSVSWFDAADVRERLRAHHRVTVQEGWRGLRKHFVLTGPAELVQAARRDVESMLREMQFA